ncbi:MAG TPA: helix-turn-helix domain-containing protein [Actinomycetota bacterium]|nr:helix-turn-helix domain-containing protein [Actinomycetota bacterium]
MNSNLSVSSPTTPLEEAVGRIGDRWSLLVIDALLGGAKRFNELADALPAISPNVLSQRLKRLEKEALVVTHPYSRKPLRLRYELTAGGRDLAGALRLLAHWGAGASESVDSPRHELCGTAIEPRWYCPTCARVVDDGEAAAELRYI